MILGGRGIVGNRAAGGPSISPGAGRAGDVLDRGALQTSAIIFRPGVVAKVKTQAATGLSNTTAPGNIGGADTGVGEEGSEADDDFHPVCAAVAGAMQHGADIAGRRNGVVLERPAADRAGVAGVCNQAPDLA